MKYKIEDKPKSQKEIEVTILPEDIKKHLEKAVHKLSSEIKIKGFRPGKAPLEMVKDIVGEEKVWQEACYEAINETYLEIIKKETFDIISAPKLEIIKMKANEPLVYKALVSVVPEVVLPDYKKKAKEVLIEKKEIKVEVEEVNKAIDSIRSSRAKAVRVSRAAKNGDEVVISFQGKIDGIAQEGLKREKMPIILGETKLIKDFEDAIIGAKEGEKKNFILKMPFTEGGHKDVEFNLEIIAVNERELPEANDEFSKSLGDFSGIDDMKKKIKEGIKLEKEDKENKRIRVRIIEEISKDTSVDVPQILIDKVTENMLHEFKNQFTQNGESFNDYLAKSEKTEEQIKKAWENQAEKRIITSLILLEIAKKENIEVTEEELEEQVTSYLDRTNEKDIDLSQLRSHLKEIIQNEKVFKMLESL